MSKDQMTLDEVVRHYDPSDSGYPLDQLKNHRECPLDITGEMPFCPDHEVVLWDEFNFPDQLINKRSSDVQEQ